FASRRFRLSALFKSRQRDVPRSREGDLARHRSAKPSMAQWLGPCFAGGGSGAGKQQQAPDCRFGERHPDCSGGPVARFEGGGGTPRSRPVLNSSAEDGNE